MRPIRSKAKIFALGLAAWSVPLGAFADSGFHAAQTGTTANRGLLLASVRPVSDAELADARGGFSAGGVNFDFGASVQTLVNGQLALQTNVQWTPTGAMVTQLQGLGTAIQTQVASSLASVGINVPTPNNPAPATASASPAVQAAAPVSAAVSPVPSAAGTMPATGPASFTGGSIASPTPPANSPASTTIVPATIAGISTTTSNSGPTSSPLAPAISSTGPAPSGTQTLTANSLVTAVAVVPSNTGSPSPAPNAPSPAGNAPASASPSLASPAVMSGVQIQSPTGTTEVLANVTNGQIQNVILNSASNQNFQQNTNIVLTIYNFASWQQMLAQHSMSWQLANQVMAASGFMGGK
jgi:hypothetical protein